MAKKITSTLSQKLKKQPPKDNSPHCIVTALAGTGKSTTILLGVVGLCGGDPTLIPSAMSGKSDYHIAPSPQQQAIWDCINLSRGKVNSIHLAAFNSSIAKHLEFCVKALGLPEYVTASTMHAMGLKAITATYGRLGNPNPNRVDDITVKLLPQFSDVWNLRRKRPGLLPLVKQLVSLCKMNLLEGSVDDLLGLMDHHMIEVEDSSLVQEAIDLVPFVLEKCADVDHDRCIDFDDMIFIPTKNDLSIKRYDLFMGDEVQDWNRCQQALAKKAGHRLILVGDPKQAIYGFAGADCESMGRMKLELDNQRTDRKAELNGRGCIVLPLTVTRRCGKAIVAEAQKIVPDFSAHETCCEGKITYASLDG